MYQDPKELPRSMDLGMISEDNVANGDEEKKEEQKYVDGNGKEILFTPTSNVQ